MDTLGDGPPPSTLDVLTALPDDERRILLAWRQARSESKTGVVCLVTLKMFREVFLFIGSASGKVLLR